MLSINQTGVMQESDSLRNHKIPMRKAALEKPMDNQSFECITTEDNGIKITLEFPNSHQDDAIILEVKSILAGMLNEYLKKVS